jgi:glycosyltransferase involved in cell wall biosynthesis
LWNAFMDLQKEAPNDWELWCFGTGDVSPINHPKIKHFGFVQPSELPRYIKDTGVFVLPSRFEPWGVVVHEFAAAGFPIICTDEVGTRTSFTENNLNGYIYKSGDINQLKEVMKKIMNHSDKELFSMAEVSVEKAKQITPEKWANTLLSVINNKLSINNR